MSLQLSISSPKNTHLCIRVIAIFFCAVFAFTVLEGLLVRQYLLPHVFLNLHDGLGFMVGGDSKGYHTVAVELAKKINTLGWSEWELRPNAENTYLATPSGIASILYVIFGSNPLFLLPFNAAVHAATATLLLVLMYSLFAYSSRLVAIIATLPFILFPTAISWTSQLLRDGVFILGAILYVWGWVLLASARDPARKNILMSVFFTLTGILVIWSVRSYMMEVYIAITVIIIVTTSVFAIFEKYQEIQVTSFSKRLFKIAIFGFFVIFVLALLSNLDKHSYLKKASDTSAIFTVLKLPTDGQVFVDHERPNSRCDEKWIELEYVPSLLNRILKSIIMAREGYYAYVYRNAGSTIDREVCLNSASDLMLYLPRALQIGLLAPFPNQWMDPNSHGQGASRKIAGVEMVVTYIALLGLICLGAGLRKKIELWIVLSYVAPMLLLLSIVTPNLGALHRQRYGFLMVLVGIGLGLIVQYVLRRTSLRVSKANHHG
jgi:hypothetical protein